MPDQSGRTASRELALPAPSSHKPIEGLFKMAKSTHPESGNGHDVSFPAIYIPVSTETRGHFQRLPEPFWYESVSESFGADAARIMLDAWRGHCLRVAQAAAKAKGVADSLEAEREAANKALSALANGTFEGSVERNPNNAFEVWIKDEIARKFGPSKATDANAAATLAAKGDSLVERASFVPRKKTAKSGEPGESEALDI
jgi:hypothetical protein